MSSLDLTELGGIEPSVETHLDAIGRQRIVERMLAKDPSLWTRSGIADIELPYCLEWVDAFEQALRGGQLSGLAKSGPLTIIGIGGASLAAEVYGSVFAHPRDRPLSVLSSTSPQSLLPYLKEDLEDARRYLVSSKSGSTVETLDIASTLFDRLQLPPQRFLAITDPGQSALRDWADGSGIRVIESAAGVAGRYSALSALNLAPAALLGIDIDQLFQAYSDLKARIAEGGAEYRQVCLTASVLAVMCEHPGCALMLSASEQFTPLARWIEQLVAESLGKSGKGVLPVVRTDRNDSSCALQASVRVNGRPRSICRYELSVHHGLAGIFYEWELIVAVAGLLAGLNPFNQPDVEGNKRSVNKALADARSSPAPLGTPDMIRLRQDTDPQPVRNVLLRLASAVEKHEYIAIMAFAAPTNANLRALEQFAAELQKLTAGDVVYEFGPQYLHSTGQFHKGGPKNGHYLMLASESDEDVQVAGKKYGFGYLSALQASIDANALEARGRPVSRILLSGPAAERLEDLAQICRKLA